MNRSDEGTAAGSSADLHAADATEQSSPPAHATEKARREEHHGTHAQEKRQRDDTSHA